MHSQLMKLGLIASLAASGMALADALPSGATPVSGSRRLGCPTTRSMVLPVQIPKGMVFVLTDIGATQLITGGIIEIYAPEDLANPQYVSPAHQQSFQTGLVFQDAPTVTPLGCQPGTVISFSGYIKSADGS